MTGLPRLTSRADRAVLAAIVAATLAHWAVLAFQLPVLTSLPDWFWPFYPKPKGSVPTLLFLAGALAAVVVLAVKIEGRPKARLWLLVLLGIGLQYGFAFTEERGIEGIRARVVHAGHAEFVTIAAQRDDPVSLARSYESLATSGALGSYARSKPPGTLLFYSMTKEVAGIEQGDGAVDEVVDALRDVITWTWPAISFLVLVPLFALARELSDERTALLACALYVLVPSVELITLHTDQVLFPLLAVLPVLLAAVAARKRSALVALCAGALLYVSLWFTFAIALVSLPVVVLSYLLAGEEAGRGKRFFGTVALLGAGFLVSDLAFRWLLGYDIAARYQGAIHHHMVWKSWSGTAGELVYYGVLDLIEFATWSGLPVSILFVAALVGSLVHLRRIEGAKWTAGWVWPAVVGGVFLLLVLTGRTKAETARLWLFLVPFVCIAAAQFLASRFGNHRGVVAAVLVLQFGTIYLIKVSQDFW